MFHKKLFWPANEWIALHNGLFTANDFDDGFQMRRPVFINFALKSSK
jgi:hypothetical protein